MFQREHLLEIEEKRVGVICIAPSSKSHPFLIGLHVPITVGPLIVDVVFRHFRIPFDAMGGIRIRKLKWAKKVFVGNGIGLVELVVDMTFLIALLCLFQRDKHFIITISAAAFMRLRLRVGNSCLFFIINSFSVDVFDPLHFGMRFQMFMDCIL